MSDSSTGKGEAESKGLLFIISGPAGSGKTTICDGLMEKESLQRIVTSTTRSPRQGERDGLDYHFLNTLAHSDQSLVPVYAFLL